MKTDFRLVTQSGNFFLVLSSVSWVFLSSFCLLNFFALKFIYLFLFYFWLHWVFAAAQAFSSCGEWGESLVVVHELLTAVVSLVAERQL